MEVALLSFGCIAIVAGWWLDRSAFTTSLLREAESKRDLRMALAYIASRHGEGSLFAGAFLGGHHQIISQHFADFHEFRGREIERELEFDANE